MTASDWMTGDMLSLEIPAHAQALRAGGADFLTRAFRAFGALGTDNHVTRITRFEEFSGGSTGRKLLLSVDYEKPRPDLHKDLFVKFSRDFDDGLRDRAKIQMELEVRFAALSRIEGFPIAVPRCYFTDFHHESGTGLLITQRVLFGTNGVEPHYVKCLDHELPQPLEHYKALISALARLAGTHKAGGLPASVARQFPFEGSNLSVSERAPYTAAQLEKRVVRYVDFAAKYPQLLPENVTSADFLATMAREIPQFPEVEAAAKTLLHARPELIALCHWNANIDNAWFWRNAKGGLECGLMDWGNVCQMNMAMSLWGSLSGADLEIWDNHLDELLALFAAEFEGRGAPALDVEELKLHLEVYIAMMGVRWLMDAPALILSQIPDLALAKDRFDPRFTESELARAQLHMMTVFLNLWQTQDLGKLISRLRSRTN